MYCKKQKITGVKQAGAISRSRNMTSWPFQNHAPRLATKRHQIFFRIFGFLTAIRLNSFKHDISISIISICYFIIDQLTAIFSAFKKFRKVIIIFVMSVSPSVLCTYGRTRLPLERFSWNMVFAYFPKVSGENLSFIKTWEE